MPIIKGLGDFVLVDELYYPKQLDPSLSTWLSTSFDVTSLKSGEGDTVQKDPCCECLKSSLRLTLNNSAPALLVAREQQDRRQGARRVPRFGS